jgi:hypothetical protein
VPAWLCRDVVVKFNVAVTDEAPGVGAAGLNEHADSVGRPEQLSDTAEPKLPPSGFTVTV